MSETTAEPGPTEAPPAPPAEGEPSQTAAELEKVELNVRSLLEAGVHFGHQTHRWNPKMRSYIFGERNGTHILDLDQTLPLFHEALDFVRETVAQGGGVLFVATKRQAAPSCMFYAKRCGQYYVNNRWLGGMLTNWKTVKRSIDRYKAILDVTGDEEKRNELSKKELSRLNRLREKYSKSLEGIKEMARLPEAMFVVDVSKEEIAVSEGRRLGISIAAVVDSNCDPDGIDYVIPGNDDAIRSVELYFRLVSDACLEGAQIRDERIRAEAVERPPAEEAAAPSAPARRVVEIKQPPRRGRGAGGRTISSGGWAERRAEREEQSDGPPAAPAEPGAGEAKGEPGATEAPAGGEETKETSS